MDLKRRTAIEASLWRRGAYLAALLGLSWPIMLLMHECGHLLGGWLSGATLKDCDLRPWRLPYSIHDPDPRPLVTLWGGPIFGAAAPMLAALLIRRKWAWFIADFCVLANGLYLASGFVSGERYLDTTMLLEKGSHWSVIGAYCLATIAIGYSRFRRNCLAIFAATLTERESKSLPA